MAVALVAVLVLVPRMVAKRGADRGSGTVDEENLTGVFREGFVEYWSSGEREFTPGLAKAVDYWFRYHLAKAVIATALLIVLVTLGVLLWRVFVRAGGAGVGRRAVLASAGVLVTLLGLYSCVTAMANVQGAAAPFAALFPRLPGAPEGELADTLDQAGQRLAGSSSAGDRTPPALEAMISDFARYHTAMAVVSTIAVVAFIGVSVMLWRKFARTEPSNKRTRRVMGAFGALFALLSLVAVVVVMANTATAADPGQPLLALLKGGW
ncbi:hypothetical protein KZO11_36820 [Streptomyces anulatus]|uniref:hypothetical protein n=1 Tax=Streptomyces anulatus TaxID=1892 RepID=UPI001C602FDB|nr:hypothetical protein [Streptomyces anulatus]QYA98740.1 hypothetical protein KZO11_36820 [Streptomyces anulatus]